MGPQGPTGPAGTDSPNSGVTQFLHVFNIDPEGDDQVVPPNEAIYFSNLGASGGGLSFLPGNNTINVQFEGYYKFYYTVSTARSGRVAFRVFPSSGPDYVDLSTVWNTGVPKATVLGIGIMYLPAMCQIQLINYLNVNDLTLQEFVNAAILMEKVG